MESTDTTLTNDPPPLANPNDLPTPADALTTPNPLPTSNLFPSPNPLPFLPSPLVSQYCSQNI